MELNQDKVQCTPTNIKNKLVRVLESKFFLFAPAERACRATTRNFFFGPNTRPNAPQFGVCRTAKTLGVYRTT